MSLTTETAVTAIAQVQAAYNCSDLDAITRMQGAAAAAGDEASLEVLCEIKGVLIAKAIGPFKMQTQTNDGAWNESGALMNFDSGDWEPTIFATEAEGFAAASKHWDCSADDLVLFCRAVVVGSADDLHAVIRQKVKNAKCLNKNANGYARHGMSKEATRLRAKRDAYMATARDAKARIAGDVPALPVTKIETRQATMRHTATLEAMNTRSRSGVYNGYALSNTIESIAESGMTAEQMVVEMQRALAEFAAHKATISSCFKATGAKIDAMTFADES